MDIDFGDNLYYFTYLLLVYITFQDLHTRLYVNICGDT